MASSEDWENESRDTVSSDPEGEEEMPQGERDIAIETKDVPFEMSTNHSKLLIMISKYGKADSGSGESWIRELPLSVMIYEGIAQGVIDCDYAPKSMIISTDGCCLTPNLNIIFSLLYGRSFCTM